MYCPLCKAEYRDGFEQCSDCFVRLVTQEQAVRTCVVMLWEGANVQKLNRIVESRSNCRACFSYSSKCVAMVPSSKNTISPKGYTRHMPGTENRSSQVPGFYMDDFPVNRDLRLRDSLEP